MASKRTASQRGKANRRRGHQFEREVAIDLRAVGFHDAKRHLEYQKEEVVGVDIDNTGQFKIQCKAKNNSPNIPAVFKEIKHDKDNDIPVVVFKVTNKGEYACFKWEDAQVLMAWLHGFSKDESGK